MQKQNETLIKKLIVTLNFLAIAFLLALIILTLIIFRDKLELESIALTGDFIGGVFGTVLTFISTIYLIKTVKMQAELMKNQFEMSKLQREEYLLQKKLSQKNLMNFINQEFNEILEDFRFPSILIHYDGRTYKTSEELNELFEMLISESFSSNNNFINDHIQTITPISSSLELLYVKIQVCFNNNLDFENPELRTTYHKFYKFIEENHSIFISYNKWLKSLDINKIENDFAKIYVKNLIDKTNSIFANLDMLVLSNHKNTLNNYPFD